MISSFWLKYDLSKQWNSRLPLGALKHFVSEEEHFKTEMVEFFKSQQIAHFTTKALCTRILGRKYSSWSTVGWNKLWFYLLLLLLTGVPCLLPILLDLLSQGQGSLWHILHDPGPYNYGSNPRLDLSKRCK